MLVQSGSVVFDLHDLNLLAITCADKVTVTVTLFSL
jgi:hypothetical protein